MNSARNKIREQNRQLNKSLESAERTAKLKKEKKSLWAKQSEILFNLAALVFGGAIIGGVFQETQVTIFAYISGVFAFAILIWWGFYLFKKSIRED